MKFEEIKELIEIFSDSQLSQIKLEDKDFSIEMKKGGIEGVVVQNSTPIQSVATPAPATIPEATATAEAPKSGELIVSPMVGTFYAAPSPDSPPFVQVGDTVRKGQTLCILEAMKIMNELEAEYDCKILEILVQDGEPVEYDKPLFRVEKL